MLLQLVVMKRFAITLPTFHRIFPQNGQRHARHRVRHILTFVEEHVGALSLGSHESALDTTARNSKFHAA